MVMKLKIKPRLRWGAEQGFPDCTPNSGVLALGLISKQWDNFCPPPWKSSLVPLSFQKSISGVLKIFSGLRREKYPTIFRNQFGSFEYLVMPFGVVSPPACFQCLFGHIFLIFDNLCCVDSMR